MSEVQQNIPIGKILVVDDEVSVRNILKTFLEYYDLTVKTAEDGVEAMEILGKENFDVLLSDIMMPRMDGLTLAGEVKNVQQDILVILMTGYASVNTAVEAIKKGVFDYVLKPFQNLEIIFQAVNRALDHRRLIQERNALIDDLTRTNQELSRSRGLLNEKIQVINSELSKRIDRLTTLYDIGRSISSITNLDELLKTIMNRVVVAMKDSIGILWINNNETKHLERVVTLGIDDESIVPESIELHEGMIGETMTTGRPRVFRRLENLSDPMLRNICTAEQVNSIVLVPLHYENKALGAINVLFRNNYFVSDDDVDILGAIADQASVSIMNAELYREQSRLFRETIEALATAIDSRDHYTGGHSYMVTRYSLAIATRMGFDKDRLELVRVAGLLHDVGKIGISDTILNKPGKLTEDEMNVIKAHPILGRVILESIDALKPAARLIYHHHERYDGKGYPEGIKGETIPLESRILQVADIYHALTSDRIYRKALPDDKAREIIREGLGTVSDPEVGRIFLEIIEEHDFESLPE